uniref:sulfotransferase 1 family member D1-like n=1 Tax=Pristiophorus japonicus TaxID=55135 RepID=UPI00398F4E16
MSRSSNLEPPKVKPPRPQLKPIHGVPLPEWLADNWAKVEHFQAKPDDVLIVTYPKAGTTWIQQIVDLINCNGDAELSKRGPIDVKIPFLEIFAEGFATGVEMIEKMPSPRFIKTHLPIQLVPKSFWEKDCKMIVLARNSKDNLVSYFHFHRMNYALPEAGTWLQFLQKFVNGQVAWGFWYDHAKGWWEAKNKHRILFLFYEDMKEKPSREILKVAKFLDKVLEEDVIEKVVELSSFAVMKDDPMVNYSTLPSTIFDQTISCFMRKGEVGDWKNHFTVAQHEAFEEDYERKMRDSSIKFRDVL